MERKVKIFVSISVCLNLLHTGAMAGIFANSIFRDGLLQKYQAKLTMRLAADKEKLFWCYGEINIET